MTFRSRGRALRATGETVREEYLICRAATLKRCPSYIHFNYTKLTNNVFDVMLHLALDDRAYEKDESRELENELAVANRGYKAAESHSKALLRLLVGDDDDELVANEYRTARSKLNALRSEQASLQRRLDALRKASTPERHVQRVDEVRRLVDSDDDEVRDDARATIKAALDELVETFEFSGLGRAVLRFKGGVRHIVVLKDGTVDADIPVFRERPVVEDSAVVHDYYRRLAQ